MTFGGANHDRHPLSLANRFTGGVSDEVKILTAAINAAAHESARL
jgi:hypothetical protein